MKWGQRRQSAICTDGFTDVPFGPPAQPTAFSPSVTHFSCLGKKDQSQQVTRTYESGKVIPVQSGRFLLFLLSLFCCVRAARQVLIWNPRSHTVVETIMGNCIFLSHTLSSCSDISPLKNSHPPFKHNCLRKVCKNNPEHFRSQCWRPASKLY